jgi:hypothetical protein
MFVPQNHPLLVRPVHIDRLLCAARRLSFRQRTTMPVTSRGHFTHQRLMPAIERSKFPLSSQRLRMPRVPFFAVHQHRPDRVQLTMLTQQMIQTEFLRRDIPNPHCSSSVRSSCVVVMPPPSSTVSCFPSTTPALTEKSVGHLHSLTRPRHNAPDVASYRAHCLLH